MKMSYFRTNNVLVLKVLDMCRPLRAASPTEVFKTDLKTWTNKTNIIFRHKYKCVLWQIWVN